jgi:DNA primase
MLLRQPPRKPEDRAVQLLLAHADGWHALAPEAQDLLHALPAPHGALVAWLERELAEHGPRPWAVRRPALAEDAALQAAGVDTARWLAEVDATDGQPADLARVVDRLLERQLKAQLDAAAQAAQADPQQLGHYRALLTRMAELKRRLDKPPA